MMTKTEIEKQKAAYKRDLKKYSGDYYTALTLRMDRKVKRAWIKALRDPKAIQANGALKTGNAYCCLGILCEILPDVSERYPLNDTGRFYFENSSNAKLLPDGVGSSVGMRPNHVKDYTSENNMDIVRIYNKYEGQYDYSLAGLNDSGFTFSQIADMIDYFL